MTLYPDPFQPHPRGDWETIWRPIALDRIKDALRRFRLRQITEDELRHDRKQSGIKRWLWYMHHPDGREGERWKNVGRPYWSHDAYTTFRRYFFRVPEAQRFARDRAPAHCTLPKKKRDKLDGLHHEHVVPQKESLDLLIGGEDPALVVARNLGAVITEREARMLPPRHPNPKIPWLRYARSGIKFIENPRWTSAERAALEEFDLLFVGTIEPYQES